MPYERIVLLRRLLQRRLGHSMGSGGHGLDDVVIARAAAQVAFEFGPDGLLVEGIPLAVHDIDGRHDHAGRAVPALKAMVLAEGRLHRVQLAALGDALDGGDNAGICLNSESGAGLHGLPVQVSLRLSRRN